MSEYLNAVARVLAGAARGLKQTPVLLFVLAVSCALIGGLVVLSTGNVVLVVIVAAAVVVMVLAALIAWVRVSLLQGKITQQIIGGRGSRIDARDAQRVVGAGVQGVRQSIDGGQDSETDAAGAQQVDLRKQHGGD